MMAAAYGALARAYGLAIMPGALSVQDSVPRAREAAMRAIALDDSQGEGHTLLGFLRVHYEFARPGAEKEYRRRLELSPNDPYAHMFYSNNYLSPLAAMKKQLQR